MADLPTNTELTGVTVTQGQFRTKLAQLQDFLRDAFGATGTVASMRTAFGLGALALRAKVQTGDCNPGAIGTADIADGAVTRDKLPAGFGLTPVGAQMAFPHSTPDPGWLPCDGRLLNRVTYAALFAKIGTIHGAGNGTTTFAIPDKRGRGSIGRDNMGGVAAGRVTVGISGISGDVIGATGGDQRMPSHNHPVNDPGHHHPVSDPGHAHPVNDPGHSHTVNLIVGSTDTAAGAVRASEAQANEVPTSRASINGSGTGISVAGAGTGIGVVGNFTGIVVQFNGGGTAQNMPPTQVDDWMIFTGVYS